VIEPEPGMSYDIERIANTERQNPQTEKIDTLSPLEIVTLINDEDAKVAPAVGKELPRIAQAVDIIVERLSRAGRLLYFGAGTSGRLGVLDASEILPTYGVSPEQVQGLIAGGDGALRESMGEAEDDREAGERLVGQLGVSEADVVVGVTASGSTPWVLGVVEEANRRGAATIALTCNPGTPLAQLAHVAIAPIVGPEVIAGSSRMKAGTAQKMVLNMLSTAAMVRLGKVFGNLMIDVRPTNAKLRRRAVRILQEAAGVDSATALRTLETTGYEVKPALVMLLTGCDLDEAGRRLAADGFVRRAAEL
jgi:N-acetylmuramic acid 6-phosphate etherase